LKVALLLGAMLLVPAPCRADGVSGPGRTTLVKLSWGSLYYDHDASSPYKVEPTSEGFRFRSGKGEVTIRTTGINSYRFTWEKEVLTVDQDYQDVTIRSGDRRWTVRCGAGTIVLAASVPPETRVYSRNANAFSIKGPQGEITGTTQFEKLTLNSPLGTTVVTTYLGQRGVTGVPVDRIPYLGRGLYIPFHGVGVFIDMARLFPLPEVAEWIEWKPITLEPPAE